MVFGYRDKPVLLDRLCCLAYLPCVYILDLWTPLPNIHSKAFKDSILMAVEVLPPKSRIVAVCGSVHFDLDDWLFSDFALLHSITSESANRDMSGSLTKT